MHIVLLARRGMSGTLQNHKDELVVLLMCSMVGALSLRVEAAVIRYSTQPPNHFSFTFAER